MSTPKVFPIIGGIYGLHGEDESDYIRVLEGSTVDRIRYIEVRYSGRIPQDIGEPKYMDEVNFLLHNLVG